MKRSLILLAAFAVVLSACKLEISVEMQIDADGSGNGTFVLSVNDQMRDLIEQDGRTLDPDEMFARFGIDTSTVDIVETREGDFTTWTAASSFATFEELKQLFAVGSDLSAIKEASFERVGNEITLTGLIDMDLESEIPDNTPVGIETIAQFITITAVVDMPGTVVEHNADRIDDEGRLVWDLTLLQPRRPIMVVSDLTSPGSGPSTAVYIGGGIGAAVVVILLLGVFRRRRSKAAS
jgi:LppM domain